MMSSMEGFAEFFFYYFYNFGGLNQKAFLYLNHLLSASYIQTPLYYLTLCFDIERFALYYIIGVLVVLVYTKARSLSEKSFLVIYNYFVQIGIIYALIGLSYAAMKFGFNMKRPFCNETIGTFTTIMNTHDERCLSSFPSSHAAISLLCAYSLWPILNSLQKLVSVFVVILVLLSRIALAMHYPADIIYSFVIAGFLIKISHPIFALLKDNIVKWVGRTVFRVVARTT